MSINERGKLRVRWMLSLLARLAKRMRKALDAERRRQGFVDAV
jgi:hypothetical protein